MKENRKIKDNNQEILKLDWEVPKLICLDKKDTESGNTPGTPEDTTMATGS